jgi:hypothetical protein
MVTQHDKYVFELDGLAGSHKHDHFCRWRSLANPSPSNR